MAHLFRRLLAVGYSSPSAVPFIVLALGISDAWSQEPTSKKEAGSRPNIVLILADDLGWGDLGCYGQTKIRTPNLDRMAKEGIRFTQFYSGSPVCAPSRCVLLTGKHAGHAAVRNNREVKPEGQHPLPAAEITIAEMLKANGYATGVIGKWGLGPMDSEGSPLSQGFDSFFGYNCQRLAHNHYPAWLWRNRERVDLLDVEATKSEGQPVVDPTFNAFAKFGSQFAGDLFEEEAIKFLHAHSEQPFFLYFASTIPHLALQVPKDSLRDYEDKWEDPPYDGKQGYTPHKTPRAAYAAMVSRLDRSVGRILDELKALELDEKTIVIFSSDNGAAHADVGGADSPFFQSVGHLRGYKGAAYEGGIRVPCIVRGPKGIAPERTSDEPLAFCDLLPTLAELAGAADPIDSDGLSFVPTLRGEGKQKPHDFLYWEFAGYTGSQVVRQGAWKAIRPRLKAGDKTTELYNLTDDPSEIKNVAAEHPEIVASLERIMSEQHTPSADFPLPTIDPSPKSPPPAKVDETKPAVKPADMKPEEGKQSLRTRKNPQTLVK